MRDANDPAAAFYQGAADPGPIAGPFVTAAAVDPAAVPLLRLPERMTAEQALTAAEQALGPLVELAARELASHHARALEHLAQATAECDRLARAARSLLPLDAEELIKHARGFSLAWARREETERNYHRLEKLASLVRRQLADGPVIAPVVEAPTPAP